MTYIMRTSYKFIKKLRAFLRLQHKVTFVYVYLLSGLIRFSMVKLPFKVLKKYLGLPKQESSFDLTSEQYEIAKQVRQLVLLVCEHTPWESKCLVRAILASHLLKRQGIKSTLYLGVSKSKDNQMQAHAWLRIGDVLIMGGENKNDFIEVAKFHKY